MVFYGGLYGIYTVIFLLVLCGIYTLLWFDMVYVPVYICILVLFMVVFYMVYILGH